MLVPHFAGCYTTPRRSRPKHHRPDLLAPRYASMLYFCQPRVPHLTASLREQPARASVPPLHLLFGTSDQLGAMPQGIHTGIESPRQEARFAGPALCQLLRNSAEEPTQASTTRLVRSALRQHVEHLPASSPVFFERDGRGLLSVTAQVAHGRQSCTTRRRRCTSEHCSSRLRTARTSTHETRGQACWSRTCLLYTSPSPRDRQKSRMPSSA